MKENKIWSFRKVSFFVVSMVTCLSLTACTSQLSGSDSQASALGATLPFAYDAQVDQIAYMSCSELSGSLNTSQYFSFRLGGYGPSAGLSLSNTLWTSMRDENTTQRGDILAASPKNSNTSILIAVHPPAGYQSIDGSGNNTFGQDYNYIMPTLGADPVNTALLGVAAGNKLRFVSTGTLPGGRFEGDLFYGTGATLMGDMRSKFADNDILGINFARSVGDAYPRGPYDYDTTQAPKTTSVYGRGLQLKFRQPNVAGLYSAYPSYVLQSVYEMNTLNNSGEGTSWNCPNNLQLRIVRVEDLAGTTTNPSGTPTPYAYPNCVQMADSQNTDQATLAIVRRSLRPEDWYVDLNHGCIIPKQNSDGQCYGSLSGMKVNYDQTALCSAPASTGATDAGTGAFVGGTCEHYVSICTRN